MSTRTYENMLADKLEEHAEMRNLLHEILSDSDLGDTILHPGLEKRIEECLKRIAKKGGYSERE